MSIREDDGTIFERLRREERRTDYPTDLPAIPPLPAQRYSDPDFYALELERVFLRTWIPAGHTSELPVPGAYKLFEELGRSVIISRGADGEVRAFKNACRHRASAILTEKSGIARRFICPYHAWGYSTDGTLKSVPEAQNFACLDKRDFSLHPVRCAVWRGFIYLNFGDDEQSLADFMAPLAEQVKDFPFEDMSVKGLITTDLDCNWKIAYDNFLESYHINTVHQKTIAPFINTKTFTVQPLPGGHGCLRTLKRGSDTLFKSEAISGGVAGGVSDRYKTMAVAIPRFPNGAAGLDPAGFTWQSFWPTSPNTMRLTNLCIGPTLDDAEADHQHWQNFISYNNAILAEDMFLFPSMQRSICAGDVSHLMLSTQEHFIQWYHEHIDIKIGPERIPEHLRVQPVLTRHFARQG
jgi:phenylpropionate dioxygenase-like ring-hydroxylating dioxygenase large terminal subunit